jgi:hypothetical protein
MTRRIFVELWDPDYGSSYAGFPPPELSLSSAEVDPEVEVPVRDWSPIRPAPEAPAERILFVDGVRRIDALVFIVDSDGATKPGLCASRAAGTVAARTRAEIETTEVKRSILTSVADVEPLETDAGTYQPALVAGETISELTSSLQEELRRLEATVSGSASGFDLLVVDGPLSTHHARGPTVGYVKSHHVRYLDERLEGVVSRLKPSERTPLFLTMTSWKRYSAYLRLEGEKTHPWSGVVRLEFAGKRSLEEARSLADVAARSLPKFSSVPHKDPRAPQNLFPIAGLERELRRRLGDHAFVHRALLAAAART